MTDPIHNPLRIRNCAYLYEIHFLIETDSNGTESIQIRRIIETSFERATDSRELTWTDLDHEVKEKVLQELTNEE